MAEVHQIIIVLLITITTVCCFCPREKIHSLGQCALRVECIGTIRGISLPDQCQGSSNYPVTIDLTLTEAIERFDERIIDIDFLASVTKLHASGNWPETALSFLEYMPRLRHLYLSNNQIQHITGVPFFHLNRLETVDLSRNNITDVEELFQFEAQPNNLRKLFLAFNSIQEIPGDAFTELTFLIELDLSYNYISDLTEEPFMNLTSLEILRLNGNRIVDLNGALNNLFNLKHLYLKGNQMLNVNEEALKNIYHLETFDVSSNQLEKLTPALFTRHWRHFDDHSLCQIILSGNYLTSVPNATSREISSRFVRHLTRGKVNVSTELDLSHNYISNIEYNAFQSLYHLISLDLSFNKLLDFVVNADDLVHIKYLNLSSNYIMNLYFDSFFSMNNLQNLDLSHNRLEYIPDQTFINNYNLKYVNMSYNEMRQLENLRIQMFHVEGGVLDLSHNDLSKLNIPVGEGLRLTMLILHSNNITDASVINLNRQSELKDLDMSRNNIEELNESSLQLPYTLTSLDLTYNKIQHMGPSSFHCVKHLKFLRLGHNQLKGIEYGVFQGLTSLSSLDLSFNNIESLDSKVLMDLKSLEVLSLRFNGMYHLDYKSWFGHKFDLRVYVDGNILPCEWLGTALTDFNNGFSKMRPTSLSRVTSGNSLEGIPCVQAGDKREIGELKQWEPETVRYVMADDRLLMTSQKILEAVREQTFYLKKYFFRLDNK